MPKDVFKANVIFWSLLYPFLTERKWEGKKKKKPFRRKKQECTIEGEVIKKRKEKKKKKKTDYAETKLRMLYNFP